MNAPALSIVIPVLNGVHTIGDTLTGLMHQVKPACETEIIVVDNGSTDDTCGVVGRFPVTLLSERKRGPAAARNRGLNAARGELVAFLDADTLPTRRWMVEMIAAFDDPAVNLAAGRILGYRPTTVPEQFYARYHLDQAEVNGQVREFPFAASGNMAVRRAMALAVGGWDEEFLVSEDVEFCHRFLSYYHTCVHYQPGALVFLRTRTTMDALKRQAFQYGQGRAKLWRRYPEVAPWSVRRQVRMRIRLALIELWPLAARAARRLGRATEQDVQDAECYRVWNRSLWLGFMSMMRHHEWRFETT